MAGTQLPMPVIGNKAHQPHIFQFPQCELGRTAIVKRLFQQQWFVMHYAFECPQSRTDVLSLVDVANNFICGHDHRKHVFGNEFK